MDRLTTSLALDLADSSAQNPKDFSESLVAFLCTELELSAVSLYLNAPESESLRLRAQAGFDYAKYKSFQLPLHTLAGKAVSKGQPFEVEDLHSSDLFLDKQLLEGTDASSGVAVPLHQPKGASLDAPEIIGVLCLYGPNHRALVDLLSKIRAVEPLISRLYVASLHQWMQDLRARTVTNMAFEQRLGRLCDTFVREIAAELTFEAGSVFVLDDPRNRTYLRGTTGLRDGLGQETISFPRTSTNLIANAIRRRTTLTHSVNVPVFDKRKVPEALESGLHNGIAIPLIARQPLGSNSTPGSDRGIGCLVLLNNFAEPGTGRQLVDITWEERAIADFAAGMLSVLVYQIQKSRDLELNYERLMHGASQTLAGSIANLDLVLGRTGRSSDVGRWVEDASAFLSDIEWQIRTGELADQPIPGETGFDVYGEVLISLRPLAKRMARARRISEPVEVNYQNVSGGWNSLPGVRGDSDALQCVFRNLVDNAMKYRNLDAAEHRIEIGARFTSELVVVTVGNNGMQIPEHEVKRLFEDGFRGYHSRRRVPQGIGKGLADSQMIVQKLYGDIRYTGRIDDLNTFEVVLER